MVLCVFVLKTCVLAFVLLEILYASKFCFAGDACVHFFWTFMCQFLFWCTHVSHFCFSGDTHVPFLDMCQFLFWWTHVSHFWFIGDTNVPFFGHVHVLMDTYVSYFSFTRYVFVKFSFQFCFIGDMCDPNFVLLDTYLTYFSVLGDTYVPLLEMLETCFPFWYLLDVSI